MTITILGSQYGESPGVGILGLFSGLAAGLIAAVVVSVTAEGFEGWGASALVAYGTVGVVFLGIAGVQHVNVPGADELFPFQIHLLASVLLAVVVAGVDPHVGGTNSNPSGDRARLGDAEPRGDATDGWSV